MTNKRVIKISSQFKRDIKRNYLFLATQEWAEVLHFLVSNIALPDKYRDHQLIGTFNQYRECHLKPNLLLIYTIEKDELHLVRLGSHSELFG